MYLSYVPLAIAVVLFVRCDVASAATKSGRIQISQMTTMDDIQPVHVVANNSPIKRLLRSPNEDEDDERVLEKQLPGDFVKNLLQKDDFMKKTFHDWDKADITEKGLAKTLNVWTSKYQRLEKVMNPKKKDELALLRKYRAYLADP